MRLAVIDEVISILSINQLHVSEYGLRDGVMLRELNF